MNLNAEEFTEAITRAAQAVKRRADTQRDAASERWPQSLEDFAEDIRDAMEANL